ncbi:MAG: hypothetical protein A2252_01860 [Elusimicrobia bacterium RIFOXYA2_FULL_39_19]|nr:MAG: hypothetical protein A2252_01860 [Elusimicrobia bacterium RIFOXYA2_FULL_39_19]
MSGKTVMIKNDRAARILYNKHPWIFSGAVKNTLGTIANGDVVDIAVENGGVFAIGTYNANSEIRLRVISWLDVTPDEKYFFEKIQNLANTKEQLLGMEKTPEKKKNYRLVYSDADGIPGLIVDRYGMVFVLQAQTLFADLNKDMWITILTKLFKPKAVYERSDVDVRKREGLKSLPKGVLHGELPENLVIDEDGFKIEIDISTGQKTGFFLDLRQVRKRVEYWCELMKVRKLQNYFAYTGSVNLYACRAGVEEVEHIDSSEPANLLAKKSAELNEYDKNITIVQADAFDHLAKTADESIDAIVLDPPSFVKHKEQLDNALDGYKRLNVLALKKLKKGGLLFTLSCSSYVSEADFQKTLFLSAVTAKADIKLLEKIGHDVDHAWPLTFPEGRYLQCVVLLKQ